MGQFWEHLKSASPFLHDHLFSDCFEFAASSPIANSRIVSLPRSPSLPSLVASTSRSPSPEPAQRKQEEEEHICLPGKAGSACVCAGKAVERAVLGWITSSFSSFPKKAGGTKCTDERRESTDSCSGFLEAKTPNKLPALFASYLVQGRDMMAREAVAALCALEWELMECNNAKEVETTLATASRTIISSSCS